MPRTPQLLIAFPQSCITGCSRQSALKMMAAPTKLQFVDPSVSLPTIDPSNQIRLLLLSSGREQSIVCRFNVVSMNEPPPYEALSYVWGSEDGPQVVTVDDHPFRVTQNLYAALHSLLPPDGAVRVLWIDAICINQGGEKSDLSERSQQVQLMGHIFAGATNVVAYLGEPYAGLLEAKEFLTAASEGQQWRVDRLTQSKDWNSAQIHSALEALFDCPWWGRIWTVQEPIVARKFCFQFGKLEIDSNVVRCASGQVNYKRIQVPFERDSKVSLLRGFEEMRKLCRWSTGETLLETLGAFQNRKSADARDKIYSLLGLFPDIKQVVKIDYTATPEQLFQDVTMACIQKHQDLKALSYLLDPASRLHKIMPSFVVDWSYQPSKVSITALRIRRQIQDAIFGACKDSKANWQLAQAGHVRANGFIFDSIDAVPAERVLERDTFWPPSLSAFQAIVDMANTRDGKGQEQTLSAIRHTLCMDCKQCGMDKKTALAFSRLHGQSDERLLSAWGECSIAPSAPAHADRVNSELGPIVNPILVASWERRFIFTEGGRMGLAPDWCRPGDVIAIMGGGVVPIVLRPLGGGTSLGSKTPLFEVVGEAYVHGVMDGEALDANGRTESNFDEIYLV